MSTAPLLESVQQLVVRGLQNCTHGRLLTEMELDLFSSIAPILLKRYDTRGTCIYISAGCEHFTAKPQEWFIGRNLDNYEGYPESFIETIKGSMARIVQSGEPQFFETTLLKPWGETRRLHYQRPERNEQGELVSILSVTFDITEKHNSQKQLERTIQEQRHFLAMMAHELRNPLAAVASGLETLDRSPGHVRATTTRDAMRRVLAHITRLIADLLDVTRLESGVVRVCMEPHSLATSLELACSITESVYVNAEQTLVCSAEQADIVVNGDSYRIAQAVSNLLHNASKFSARGARVDLITRVVSDTVQIDISDSAGGIPLNERERIFERYHRGDVAASSEQSGLGLGLYVSREIVRQHGGELELVRSSDKGSLFRISLPVCSAVQIDAGIGLPSNHDVLPNLALAEPSPKLLERGADVKSILIVDDNRSALDLLTLLLELEGYEVYSASTAADGERLFVEKNPYLVLLDIGLPDSNGCDLARRIRAYPSGGKPLLVALTGWASEEDAQCSLDAGFDVHLAKPVRLVDLLAVLKQHAAE